MTKLILIRGLPGSGKSTCAEGIIYAGAVLNGPEFVHLEADKYFMVDGEYKFDRDKLHQAHSWCLSETIRNLYLGNNVIVSNTFTTLKELKPYVALKDTFKVELEVLRCTGAYGSIHGVPEETMEKMRARFADYEGEVLIG